MLARLFGQWPVPTAAPGTVLCVGLHLQDMSAWPDCCRAFTTAYEQRTARRFAQVADAARHMAGRALARRMLHALTGQSMVDDFASTPHGKPFYPLTTAEFSISHSGDMVWVALCRSTPVGIDVEKMRPLPDAADLTGQLHPHERQALLALPETELETAFYRCWTRKEALLKAVGTGLSTPLQDCCVRIDQQDDNWVLRAPTPAAGQWTSRDLAVADGYQCSVAAQSPRLHLEVHHV
ncbi:4'-phosphopantetheinyl transferase superfamily protein [Desulfovibrio desulfuricans]|uniref:4'-phosphopantetheinyl transferase family protein n=1 Tax=Desulfovibrio desulfuricans TaxID=876 RepID=UPI0035B495B4